jgi:hypothetical protein
MAKEPTPATVTFTELGMQPAESAYFTEKVNRVAVVPLPGVAFPRLREMVCAAPLLQLPASTAGAAASVVAVSANEMTRRRRMSVPSRA